MRLTHKLDDQEKLTFEQLVYMHHNPVLVYHQGLLWSNSSVVSYVFTHALGRRVVLRRDDKTHELSFDEYEFYAAEVTKPCPTCGIELWPNGICVTCTNENPVNHPSHYNQHPSGVECIEITRHMNFCLGNAMKYIWRAGLKDSTTKKEDLQKAIRYLEYEVEHCE